MIRSALYFLFCWSIAMISNFFDFVGMIAAMVAGEYKLFLYGRYELMWPAGGRSADEPEILEWCIEQFGRPARDPKLFRTPRWLQAADAAYFRDPDDAFIFKMRWG